MFLQEILFPLDNELNKITACKESIIKVGCVVFLGGLEGKSAGLGYLTSCGTVKML